MEAAIIAQAVGQAAGSTVVPGIQGSKGIFDCLKRKYGYVKHKEKNFAKLKKEEECLCDEEDRVMEDLRGNKLSMKMTRGCETWFEDVNKMKDEIKTLKTNYQKTSSCFCGLCPVHTLLKLGKRIVKMTNDIVSLKEKIGQMTVMVPKQPDLFIRRHAKNIKQFPSLYKHVEKLLEFLGDKSDKLQIFRVWGPEGVGKTTIMENLHDAVGDSGQFEIIFWVTIKTNVNKNDIQESILKRLNINMEKADEHSRAHIISEELKNKKYVLFLDGVASEIDFTQIGIHKHHTLGKVVFACRYRKCCEEITAEEIHVQRLSDEDAEKLFWEIAGEDLKSFRDIMSVGKKIIYECGGMPHVIRMIGNRLADVNDAAIWRARLDDFISPSTGKKQKLEEFYKAFKLVYEQLSKDMQPYLLYWAIFPGGYELHRDYIIECWRAEQFFVQFKKLRRARDEGHDLLNQFIAKSLLEKGEKLSHYKMSVYYQRAALRIANQNENSFRVLVKETEMIREEEWENANRLSLIRLRQPIFPKKLNCCKILTLLLRESTLNEFPRSFFDSMCSLQLLDLHNTNVRLLPTSISNLKNLNALFLNDCRQLVQLPSEIGDLCKLEILDVRRTGIHCLPIEIGKLSGLKCLRVSFVDDVGNLNHVGASAVEMISSNMISRLHCLEELIIEVLNPTNSKWRHNVERIVAEVAALEELTTLCFCFPTVECLQNFMEISRSSNGNNILWGGNGFRSFNILVGYQQRNSPVAECDISECSAEKHLRFSAGVGIIADEVKIILEQAHSFELIDHHDAVNLSEFGADKLRWLETCMIEDCKEMTSIIDGNFTRGVAFQCLRKLHIKNLPKLVHIWEGSIACESLKNLTTLMVKKCHSLKILFSKEMIPQLNRLQCLQVEDCEVIEEIIEAGSVVDSGAFPKLKTLELTSLPKLSTICSSVSAAWPSLETIKIKTCEELKSFPYTFKNVTKLRVIMCAQNWLDQLDWQDDTDLKDRFQRLHRAI